jgi:hypothetical protein
MRKQEAEVRLGLIEELSRKWHKHQGRIDQRMASESVSYEMGMMRGYAESIRLLLGASSLSMVEERLRAGSL